MPHVSIKNQSYEIPEWDRSGQKGEQLWSVVEKFHHKELGHKSLFLVGDCGSGKTLLAKHIMAKGQEDGRWVIYITLQEILGKCRRLMDAPTVETADSWIDWLCNFNGLLIIDEIGRSRGGDWDQNQVLFPLLDRRLDKYNIWISNFKLDQLAVHYDNSISSRLQSGAVVDFSGIEDHRGK